MAQAYPSGKQQFTSLDFAFPFILRMAVGVDSDDCARTKMLGRKICSVTHDAPNFVCRIIDNNIFIR